MKQDDKTGEVIATPEEVALQMKVISQRCEQAGWEYNRYRF